MFFRLSPKLVLVAFLLVPAFSAFSQVAPAARESGIPFSVGGGLSYWDVDWAINRMDGATLWIDWQPNHISWVPRGLGLEAEARDVSWKRGYAQANFREVTVGGGVIYSWRHFNNFHPYGKYVASFGRIDFRNSNFPNYTHDSRTVAAPGLGVEYRVFRHIWARADYEYQFWPNLFGANKTLDPQGFTFGAMYDFKRQNRR